MTQLEFQGFSSIIIVTLMVLLHHYSFSVEKFQTTWGDREASVSVYLHRLMGFVVLGMIPLLLSFPLALGDVGLGVAEPVEVGLVTVALGLLAGLIVASVPVNAALLAHYPMVRRSPWSRSTHVASNTSWVVFLLGYEFMYRGFLLFSLANSMGSVLAVAVTTSLYALHHLPKAADEAFVSIAFGVVLGVLAIWSGGFWPAFVLHVVVAVIGEYNFLRAHPTIRG